MKKIILVLMLILVLAQAKAQSVCGNAAIEAGETCEGTDFDGNTCATYGYNSGSLVCIACNIEIYQCYNAFNVNDNIYNVTPIQSVTTIQSFIVQVNNAVDKMLVTAFLFAFFFIFLMVLKNHPFEDSLLASCFVFFILSIMLRMANLIDFKVVLMFLIALALSGLYKFQKG